MTFWLALGLTLALLLVGYLAIVWLGNTPSLPPVSQEPTPVQEPTQAERLREQELQGPAVVIAAEVSKASDIDEYSDDKPIPLPTKERSIAPFASNEHVYGKLDTPFTIIQFSSLTNPYSAVMHKEFAAFIDSTPNVNWVFRHYPIHTEPWDYTAAQLSECVYVARGDSAFWKFLDLAFAAKDVNEASLISLAEQTGTPKADLTSCLQQESVKNHVVLDKLNAQLYGKVLTVPSYFFVNNKTGELRFVEGANSIKYMKAVLEAMQ